MVFFATFAFNIRKVFLTKYSFLNGTYNDFLTPSIRMSDIVILLFIIIYIIKYVFSQARNTLVLRFSYSYIQSALLKRLSMLYQSISRATFFIFLLWLWICLSVTWAPFKSLALYKACYFTEVLIFFVLAYKFALNKAYPYKRLELAIIVSGTVQSIIAVSQFVKNGSLGIKFLGESVIGSNIAGVAKISLFGVKHIRAYGTFPHPNVLAGFLVLPIFIVIDILINSKIARAKNSDIVSHETNLLSNSETLYFLFLLILILGFILTFSRSAYLGLIIGFFIYFLKYLNVRKLYTKHKFSLAILLSICITLAITTWETKPNSLFSLQSYEERSLYNHVSREIISNHPFQGVGIGQFVFEEYMLHETFQGWQYQPVHNLYLLITSEIGIIGIILFLLAQIILFQLCNNIILAGSNSSG